MDARTEASTGEPCVYFIVASQAALTYPEVMIRHAPRHDRIAIDPAIMLGKPVIRGTRITVEQLLRELGAGMTADEILTAHPRLVPDDIRAAQAFAADWLAEETVTLADA